MNGESEPFSRRAWWLAFAAFALYEAALCLCVSCSFDLEVYARYSGPLHPDALRQRYETWDIEYPPLSVLYLSLVDALTGYLSAPDWFRTTFPNYNCDHVAPSYMLAFHVLIAVCVLATFAILWRAVERTFAHESRAARMGRLMTFAMGLLPLSFVLHDRLDFPLGLVTLLFLVCLMQRRHWFWSGLCLAAMIGYKIVPVVLVPVWILATMDMRREGRVVGDVLMRLVVLAALVLLPLAAFYLVAGPRVLVFLTFHGERGIEVESTYAAILGICKLFGAEVTSAGGFGCWELRGPLTEPMVRIAPFVIGIPLLVAVAHLAWRWRSAAEAERQRLIVGHTIVAVLIVLFGNKVLSPQYLLWLLPIAPLVPLRGRQNVIFQVLTLLLCFTTMLIFPCFAPELINDGQGPTPLATGLLVARSVVFVALIALLAGALVSKPMKSHACE